MKHKHYFKKITASLLCGAIGLSLCACHGSIGSAEFVRPDTLDETTEYEITFWAKNDTNKSQSNVYKQAIEDFEKLYPNVTVNLKLYTDYNRIYNDVITNISTGTTPNVCITYPDHIATYMTGNNVVVPLDELITDSEYGFNGSKLKFTSPDASEIIDTFLEEEKLGDHYYGLPYMRSTEALYINKTYVEELGYELPDILTWDFIFEVSEAALAKNSAGKYKLNNDDVMVPFIYKSTDNMMISMLKQLDAGYSDDEGNELIFNDNTRAILKEVATHAQTGAFSTFAISGYPANFLDAGQCVFAVDSTAGSTWMGAEAPLSDIAEEDFVDFETVVRPIPQYDTENIQMISQGPSVCIFKKDDASEVMYSWLFAQFLLTDKVQVSYAMTEGYVPVTTSARESAEYQDYLSRAGQDNSTYYDIKLEATNLLLNNTENTFVTPVFNGSTSLRNAAGALIEDTVKSERRGTVVDDAVIEDIFEDVSDLYRLTETSGLTAGKQDLGELPAESKALIIILVCAWVLIGLYFIHTKYKERRIDKE